MNLYLNCKDCKAAIVLYQAKNVITHHDSEKQSLSLPVVPVLKRHLAAVIAEEPDNLAKAIHESVVNIDLDPILGAFAYAALEHVESLNCKIRSIKHIKNQNYDYLFKNDIYPTVKEIFAIELMSAEIFDESMVGIKVDKIFCKIGTANNNDMNLYYNGLKIDPISAIVLIEYWELRLSK